MSKNNNLILTNFLKSKPIRIIEEEIIWEMSIRKTTKYNDNTNSESLLRIRKELINDFVLNNQAEFLPVIVNFNENLTKNLHRLYDKVCSTYKLLLSENKDNNFTVQGKCFFDNIYSKNHPVQGNKRKILWEALTDEDNNPSYQYGITNINFRQVDKRASTPSFSEIIYLGNSSDNWNESLGQNLTKDLNLIYPFHNLFDHSNFALTDFIYCQDYNFNINCDIDI